jgi:hypothetical protein
LADDAQCQAQVELLVQYGDDLFSDHDHQKWDAAPLIGVDVLRFRIRGALVSLRARLSAMECPTTKNPSGDGRAAQPAEARPSIWNLTDIRQGGGILDSRRPRPALYPSLGKRRE